MYFCSKSGFKMWFVALKNGWGYAEKTGGLARFSIRSPSTSRFWALSRGISQAYLIQN